MAQMEKKFQKLVAIEPVSLIPSAQEELKQYADQVILYEDIPADEEEIVRRIGDAEAVLVSYTSQIRRQVIEQCPNIRYIGMCCSLYSEESANVDIACAREHGIQVLGIRDYGDRGVVEYVLYQLVRILHGFDYPMWEKEPLELTDLKVGIVGLGAEARRDHPIHWNCSYHCELLRGCWEQNPAARTCSSHVSPRLKKRRHKLSLF